MIPIPTLVLKSFWINNMYKVVFNNGAWKIKDMLRYEDILMFGTEKEARASLLANTTEEQRA